MLNQLHFYENGESKFLFWVLVLFNDVGPKGGNGPNMEQIITKSYLYPFKFSKLTSGKYKSKDTTAVPAPVRFVTFCVYSFLKIVGVGYNEKNN